MNYLCKVSNMPVLYRKNDKWKTVRVTVNSNDTESFESKVTEKLEKDGDKIIFDIVDVTTIHSEQHTDGNICSVLLVFVADTTTKFYPHY